MPDRPLKGQKALVTGASSGVGEGIARALGAVGKVTAFLASDDPDYIHGQTIFVDGGMTLYPEFAEGG